MSLTGILFIISGVLFYGLAVFFYWLERRGYDQWETAIAIVDRRDCYRNPRTYNKYFLIGMSWEINGKRVTYPIEENVLRRKCCVGDVFILHYDPIKPYRFYVEGNNNVYLAQIVNWILGSLFLLAGIIMSAI